jgi:hypothetical protein
MNKFGIIIEEKRVHFVIVEAEDEDSACEKAAGLGYDDYHKSDIDGTWEVSSCRKYSAKVPDDKIAKEMT